MNKISLWISRQCVVRTMSTVVPMALCVIWLLKPVTVSVIRVCVFLCHWWRRSPQRLCHHRTKTVMKPLCVQPGPPAVNWLLARGPAVQYHRYTNFIAHMYTHTCTSYAPIKWPEIGIGRLSHFMTRSVLTNLANASICLRVYKQRRHTSAPV